MSEENTQHMPAGRSFEERVFARFDALEARFDSRLDGLNARLTSLEEKVEQRLKETRPIREQVLVRLDGVERRLAGVEKNMDNLNRKFHLFNEDILSWQNKQDNLEERASKLESERAQ